MGRHLKTAKQFIYHKIRHRYLRLNKSPARIAEELGLECGFVNRVCTNVYFTEDMKNCLDI